MSLSQPLWEKDFSNCSNSLFNVILRTEYLHHHPLEDIPHIGCSSSNRSEENVCWSKKKRKKMLTSPENASGSVSGSERFRASSWMNPAVPLGKWHPQQCS